MSAQGFPRRIPFEVIERQMHYRNRHVCDLSLHGILRLEGHIDANVAARAVRLCADVFPIYGCVAREGPWGLSWVRLGDLDRIVWCDVVECEDEAAALDAYMRMPRDPWSGTPPLHVRILRTAKGDAVVIKIHHAAADAISGKETSYTFAELYRTLLEHPEYRAEPRAYVRKLDLSALSLRQKLSVAREALEEQATTDQTGFVGVPLVHGGPSETRFIDHRVPKGPFRALRRYARDHKAAFHDLMNALLAHAVLQRFGEGKAARVRIRNPVDLRRYDPRAKAVEGPRNLAGFASFDVAPESSDLEAVLIECRDQFHRLFEGSRCPGLGTYPKMWLRDLLPNRPLTESSDRRWAKALAMKDEGVPIQLPLIVSNAGVIDKRRILFPGATVVDAVTIGFAYFHSTFFSFQVYDGELSLVVRFCDKDGMGDHVRALLAIVDEQVAHICRREERPRAA
jgi:NRPS condensation-like uncharacterized protein